jgi:hypothetical protein
MVLEHIGEVAYMLQLLAGAKIHDMFHVGLLKAYRVEESMGSASLPPVRHGWTCLEPSKVIKIRMARGQLELLVCWMGQHRRRQRGYRPRNFALFTPLTSSRTSCSYGGEREMSCVVYSTDAKNRTRSQQKSSLIRILRDRLVSVEIRFAFS